MGQLAQDDYIEHWRDGIGKIIKVDNEAVVISFLISGKKTIPKEKTAYFKNKLNPNGLLVQIYENKEQVINLIENKSTEIIKLLIYDETNSSTGKILRSRIKPLLTKAKTNEEGWRREFGLIDDKNWKKWWSSINKKIASDTWFDTSSKSEIILREKPISEAQNVYVKYLKAKAINKKLSFSEQVIKAYNEDDDPSMLEDLSCFLNDLLLSNPKSNIFFSAIFSAIQLCGQKIEIKPFTEKAYQLTFELLIKSNLPSQKKQSAYIFFCGLQPYNITDHLIIFLNADKKLRAIIKKNILTKKWDKPSSLNESIRKDLEEYQVGIINYFIKSHKGPMNDDLVELLETVDNKYVHDFFISLLIVKAIDQSIKDEISKVIINHKLTPIIFSYFNNVKLCQGVEIPYLPEFLSLFSTESAELTMKQNLLDQKTAQMRPEVFLAALKSLVSDSIPSINASQKNSLFDHINDLLSNRLVEDKYSDLKLQVDKIVGNLPVLENLKRAVDEKELVRISKDRSLLVQKRLDSISLIIQKGLKEECQKIIIDLTNGITEDDFKLFEIIFRSFPDDDFAKALFMRILKVTDFSEKGLKSALSNFVKVADLIPVFSNFILLNVDDEWHQNNYRQIINILEEDNLARGLINFGIESIFSNAEPSKIIGRLASYCTYFPNWTLEEMHIISKNKLSSFKAQIDKIKNEHVQEQKILSKEKESHLLDAINRTSQRYEEYLKRLIPHLNGLESVIDTILTDVKTDNLDSLKPSLVNKLSIVKDDIEWVLKILNVIERD